jgi:MFS family permease
VLLIGLTANAALGWWWADPVAALVIAAVAVEEGRDAWRGDACCMPGAEFSHDLVMPVRHDRRVRGRFWWVWSGEALSLFGDLSFEVAFAWLILSTSGSPGTLGLVLVVGGVPRALLLLAGGAITDRFSPRAVMLVSHLGRAVAVTALTVLVAADALRLWHLYAIAVTFGVAEAFFWPASASIVPTLVAPDRLPRANALVGAAEQAARLGGPLLGGVLVALGGNVAAMAFNAATFLVAAGTVLAAPRTAAGQPTPLSLVSVGAEIRAGLRYAARSFEIRIVLVVVSAATLSYAGLFRVGLPALSQHFSDGTGRGAVGLGVLLAAWGLGQLAGTVAAAVTGLPRRWGLLIVVMAVAEGATFAVLGFVPTVAVAAMLLALLGVGVAYSSDVALPTFVQTRTPPELLGRVNSLIDLPRVSLEPVSVAVLGLLAAIDVRWAFVAAAVPTLAAGVWLALSPRARRMTAAAGPAGVSPPPGT